MGKEYCAFLDVNLSKLYNETQALAELIIASVKQIGNVTAVQSK